MPEEIDVPEETSAVLETRGLCKDFRGFRAVSDGNLAVTEGDVHALVGPNGAGKTTLFNLLTGFLRPSDGTISLQGQDITGKPPEQIAQLGVARSVQITSLFELLSLRHHVELALQGRTALGYRFWASDKLMRRFRDPAMELLEQVGLARFAEEPAGVLAYGRKRALELALASALDPKLLLLDEPTAGMGVEDIERTVELVRRVRTWRHGGIRSYCCNTVIPRRRTWTLPTTCWMPTPPWSPGSRPT
ncbi:hypothetical protein BH20ACT5_BH20ACT5_21980 [soil metagenome]